VSAPIPADSVPPPPAVARAGLGLVDLNTATREELESLPGIGPVLAGRILEQRQRAGRFRAIEELLAVRGIGPRLFGRIRERVTAGARSDSARR
jgi:competence protein ComEA